MINHFYFVCFSPSSSDPLFIPVLNNNANEAELSKDLKEIIQESLKDKKQPQPLYLCEHCDFTGSEKEIVETHVSKKHNQNADCPCRSCDKWFQTYEELALHAKRVHRKNPYICGECDFKATEFGNCRVMWYHMRARHLSITGVKERPLTCKVCGFKNDSHGMWDHMRRSHMKTDNYCCGCKRYFTSKARLQIHNSKKHSQKDNLPRAKAVNLRTIAPKPVSLGLSSVSKPIISLKKLICPTIAYLNNQVYLVCEVCRVSFSSKLALQTHLKKFHRSDETSTILSKPLTLKQKALSSVAKKKIEQLQIR